MDDATIRKLSRKLSRPHRVERGDKFRLKDHDPGSTGALREADKERAQALLEGGKLALAELQEKLYAQDRWSVLCVFQAMDAAGKDGAIKHVMSGINPQGCQVHSFKAPSHEELDHDFLWRCACRLPERGRIGIFNRSYYEEVLVVKVHPAFLAPQRLPEKLVGKRLWDERYQDIRGFERHLARNGTAIVKFFLHVSRDEQRRRFLERIEERDKHWKFSAADVRERAHWDDYMDAYETMIRETSSPYAPWYVVPADNKWYTRVVVAGAIVDALERLDLSFPTPDKAQLAELAAARKALIADRK
jgi:PPK2 family polyphosphate:nucleotide phosphotransferase